MLNSLSGHAGNETERKMVLDLLLRIWDKYPGLRLGQLIINACGKDGLYYISDAELVAELSDYPSDDNKKVQT